MDISDIDYLILSQVWPDNILSDEAGQLARELNLSCPVVSINVGTNGGVAALEIATAMFANSGLHNIAVIAGCNYSHWFSTDDPARCLLSDGAACLILSRKQGVEVTGCHSLSTAHYDILQFNEAPERYVFYKEKGGEYIFNNLKETIYQCCSKVCQSNGINLNEVSAFYIYDPTEWVVSSAVESLGVGKDKVISIFHKYGSLGPAQSFFGFMEIQNNKNLVDYDWVIVMGFGPSSTATAVLFRWQNIPYGIYCYDHKTQLSSLKLSSRMTENI
nr:3-oxoacyl-[acyl-carrier-protein] synthase III C-terminal domain-containing protein [Xenorhabdus sp. PB62.4]